MKPAPESTPTAGWWATRFSSVELLGALILLFVVTPFVEELRHGDLIEAALLTAVFVLALLAVGNQRRTFVVGIGLLAPVLAGKWAHHLYPGQLHPAAHLVAALVFLAFVVSLSFRFILRAPRVNSEVLCAGVSTYLLLGLLWAMSYRLVDCVSPGSFSFSTGTEASRTMDGFNAFYFSFVTLCTVGYGDVAPVSRVARMLTVMEAITGMFYVAILISRLVSLYSRETSSKAGNSASG